MRLLEQFFFAGVGFARYHGHFVETLMRKRRNWGQMEADMETILGAMSSTQKGSGWPTLFRDIFRTRTLLKTDTPA
jgi:hypothetical protein